MSKDIKPMTIVDKAIRIATEYHDTWRNGSGLPYIIHPIQVMMDGYERGMQGEVFLSACVMHDVLEDTVYKEHEMLGEFGSEITELVKSVSKIGIDDAGIKEKMDFLHTFTNKPIESILLKMSDRYCNIRDYEKTGKRPWYPGYYALQAYPLLRAFIDNKFSIQDNLGRDTYAKYHDIAKHIDNLVINQYNLNLFNKDNNVEIEKILADRYRGDKYIFG